MGTLYIVGTPIGNLEDLSLRAARVLREVDVIAAEDTRSAKTLLAQTDALGAVNPHRRGTSFFEGNEGERSAELVAILRARKSGAGISEARMPGVSDPRGGPGPGPDAPGARPPGLPRPHAPPP